jgi:magnesium transporter
VSEVESRGAVARLHNQLEAIVELLRRHGDGPVPVPAQTELRQQRDVLQSADIASILESLPLLERLVAWQLTKVDRDGEILLELPDAVRESLSADMDRHEILAAVEPLEGDELADLVEDLPTAMLPELKASLDCQPRA